MSAPTRNQLPLTEPHPSGPFPIISPEKRKASKKAIAIGAGLLVSAGVTFGVVEALTPSENDKSTSIDSGSEPIIERPAGMTADNASSVDFYNDNYFTDAERVEWANEQLNAPSAENPDLTVEQAAYEHIKTTMMERSGVPLQPLVNPSPSNTPNEVGIQQMAIQGAAMYEMDFNKAKKLLAATFDNNSLFYESFVDDVTKIRQSNPTQAELYNETIAYTYTPFDPNQEGLVPQATGVSSEAPLGTIQPVNNEPTRVVMKTVSQKLVDLPDFEEVQTFVDGKRWVAEEKISPSDTSSWIQPENLINLGH
jgi:hypothetical protein